MRFGSAQDTLLNFPVYNDKLYSDPYGEVYIKNLKPGDYVLFASGFDGNAENRMESFATLHIISRSRQNDVSIVKNLSN